MKSRKVPAQSLRRQRAQELSFTVSLAVIHGFQGFCSLGAGSTSLGDGGEPVLRRLLPRKMLAIVPKTLRRRRNNGTRGEDETAYSQG